MLAEDCRLGEILPEPVCLRGGVSDRHTSTHLRRVCGVQLVDRACCVARVPPSSSFNRIELPSPAVCACGLSHGIQVQAQLRKHVEGAIVEVLRAEYEQRTRWGHTSRSLRSFSPRSILCRPVAPTPLLLMLVLLPTQAFMVGSSDALMIELSHGGLIQQNVVAPIVLIGSNVIDFGRSLCDAVRHIFAELSWSACLLARADDPIEVRLPTAASSAKSRHLWMSPLA
mmetsp:Transcript_44393/g.105148  ORF Transcript_44393/g.105148 Transcript_44393/m.105148 type:complete len:227 (-) Transcript_44393:290-970(-)